MAFPELFDDFLKFWSFHMALVRVDESRYKALRHQLTVWHILSEMHSQGTASSDNTTKKGKHLNKSFLINKVLHQGNSVSLKATDIPKHAPKRSK